MIEKIISGGQVGADIAALRAGRVLNLRTGGWMPLGFRTLDGDKPEYAEEFGMQENQSPKYNDRTFLNVRDADVTVRFALNFDSPGERCTMKAIRTYGKPYYDVPIFDRGDFWGTNYVPSRLALDLYEDKVKVLNVAGNANSGIENFVELYLIETVEAIRMEYQ